MHIPTYVHIYPHTHTYLALKLTILCGHSWESSAGMTLKDRGGAYLFPPCFSSPKHNLHSGRPWTFERLHFFLLKFQFLSASNFYMSYIFFKYFINVFQKKEHLATQAATLKRNDLISYHRAFKPLVSPCCLLSHPTPDPCDPVSHLTWLWKWQSVVAKQPNRQLQWLFFDSS